MITTMMFIWLIFVVFMLYVYQCLRLRNRPPLLGGAWPIIGHSLMIAKDVQSLMENEIRKCFKRGVDIATVRLGAWDISVILNPEDGQLVANSCPNKDSLYNLLKPYFGEGLITANGHIWMSHRRLITPFFNQRMLDGYLSEFNNGANKLVRTISKHERKGPFNHFAYFNKSIFETVCATIIGIPKDDEDAQIYEHFKTLRTKFFEGFVQKTTKIWFHIDFVYSLCGKKKRQELCTKELRKITQKILEKKKVEFNSRKTLFEDENVRHRALLDHLLQLSDNGQLSEKEVTDEMNTFVTAANDTLSISLPMVLLCVGSYEHVQQKIVDEFQSVFGDSDRDVDKQDLSQLKYLEAVIKETLRLYPSLPIIGKTVHTDLKIRDYTLPSGSKCYIVLYALLRHPWWGADATVFRPERWLDGSLTASHRALAAFGIGKRVCIGTNYAITMMKTYVCRFLRSYSVTGDVTNLQQIFLLLSRPVKSHHIAIQIREGFSAH